MSGSANTISIPGRRRSQGSGSDRDTIATFGDAALWSTRAADLLHDLETSPTGLTSAVALQRLQDQRLNRLGTRTGVDVPLLLLRQFTSPIVLLLLGAALLSFLLHDSADVAIVMVIVAVSGLLGFWQERGAAGIVAKLLEVVDVRATVLRDGRETQVPAERVVAGDVVALSAGSSIPADCSTRATCFSTKLRSPARPFRSRKWRANCRPRRHFPGEPTSCSWALTS
jgi:magnesium-transporting ATPase (P-type)